MGSFIPTLWASIESSGLSKLCAEIIFVNDGSTDSTEQELQRLQQKHPRQIHILTLASNLGRYQARLQGATHATAARVLFLDSRVVLANDFGEALTQSAARYPNLVGSLEIDTSRNVFCLYWERSHHFIFSNHFEHSARPITLDPLNFDRYLKGTTVFLCSRKLFLAACKKFQGGENFSDDTKLMKEIVQHEPIVIVPSVKIFWTPRETLGDFLWRLIQRGPGFVEYHIFERQGQFFWIVTLALLFLVASTAAIAAHPEFFWRYLFFTTATLGATAFFFGKTVTESLKMIPLHLLVVGSFAAGVIWGIIKVAGARIFHTKMRS